MKVFKPVLCKDVFFSDFVFFFGGFGGLLKNDQLDVHVICG